MTERFVVINDSLTLHDCCFEATVVDTSVTDHRGRAKPLCECQASEDANLIACALNGLFKMATVH